MKAYPRTAIHPDNEATAAPGVHPYNRNESGSEDGNPSGAGTTDALGVQPYGRRDAGREKE